jgi:hypothetical protein
MVAALVAFVITKNFPWEWWDGIIAKATGCPDTYGDRKCLGGRSPPTPLITTTTRYSQFAPRPIYSVPHHHYQQKSHFVSRAICTVTPSDSRREKFERSNCGCLSAGLTFLQERHRTESHRQVWTRQPTTCVSWSRLKVRSSSYSTTDTCLSKGIVSRRQHGRTWS